MTIICKPFDLNIEHLAANVATALRQLGGTPPPRKMKLIDPLPIYTGRSDQFRQLQCKAELTQTGWRALILSYHDEPIACVDIFPARPGGRGTPTYAVRGAEQARALMEVMLEAEKSLPQLTTAHEPRIITFPDLFIDALWLAGADDWFFLIRGNGGSRMSAGALGDVVGRQIDSRR